MHVLIAPHHFGPMFPPDVAARALAQGWGEARPRDTVRTHPLSDGTTGFLHTVPGATEIFIDAGAPPGPASVVRRGTEAEPWHTVYCYTDHFRPAHPVDFAHLREASSAPVGEILGHLLARGAKRIVIGTGDAPWHDGGAGLLKELATHLGLPGADTPLRGPDGEISPELARLIAPVGAALRGVSIVVAAARDLPLRGLHGAGAEWAESRVLSAQHAQDLENSTLAFTTEVDRVVQDQEGRTLLAAAPTVASRRAYLGAGGGVAYILAALGARVHRGAEVGAAETDLAGALPGHDLVVTGARIIAGEELGHGVIAHVAATAAAEAIPVVAVGGRIDASRGQLLKAGVTSAYPVTDISSARPAVTAPAITEAALVDRGRRLAKTWSR